jgi:hypothetical protein
MQSLLNPCLGKNCDNNSCGQHGQCVDVEDTYYCLCDTGYGGTYCKTTGMLQSKLHVNVIQYTDKDYFKLSFYQTNINDGLHDYT